MADINEELKCPVCGNEMLVGRQENSTEPMWYCDHESTTVCVFVTSDATVPTSLLVH